MRYFLTADGARRADRAGPFSGQMHAQYRRAIDGAAIHAAHGAGHCATIDDGAAATVHPGRVIDPIPSNVAAYDELFQKCRALCPTATQVLAR